MIIFSKIWIQVYIHKMIVFLCNVIIIWSNSSNLKLKKMIIFSWKFDQIGQVQISVKMIIFWKNWANMSCIQKMMIFRENLIKWQPFKAQKNNHLFVKIESNRINSLLRKVIIFWNLWVQEHFEKMIIFPLNWIIIWSNSSNPNRRKNDYFFSNL